MTKKKESMSERKSLACSSPQIPPKLKDLGSLGVAHGEETRTGEPYFTMTLYRGMPGEKNVVQHSTPRDFKDTLVSVRDHAKSIKRNFLQKRESVVDEVNEILAEGVAMAGASQAEKIDNGFEDFTEAELVERVVKGVTSYDIPTPTKLGIHEPGRLFKKGEPQKGTLISLAGSTNWVVSRATATKVTIRIDDPSSVSKPLTYSWDGTGYERQGGYLHTDGIRPAGEWRLPKEHEQLSSGTKVKSDRYNYIIAGPGKEGYFGMEYPARTKRGTKGTLEISGQSKGCGSWTTPKGTRTDLSSVMVQVFEEQTPEAQVVLEAMGTIVEERFSRTKVLRNPGLKAVIIGLWVDDDEYAAKTYLPWDASKAVATMRRMHQSGVKVELGWLASDMGDDLRFLKIDPKVIHEGLELSSSFSAMLGDAQQVLSV